MSIKTWGKNIIWNLRVVCGIKILRDALLGNGLNFIFKNLSTWNQQVLKLTLPLYRPNRSMPGWSESVGMVLVNDPWGRTGCIYAGRWRRRRHNRSGTLTSPRLLLTALLVTDYHTTPAFHTFDTSSHTRK